MYVLYAAFLFWPSICNLIVPCDYYQYMWYVKMLANHFHLRLMIMYSRLYFTDPLNGVSDLCTLTYFKAKSSENMSILIVIRIMLTNREMGLFAIFVRLL